MIRHTLTVVTFVLAGVLLVTASSRAASPEKRPKIGLWYTVWWTVEDEHRHWVNCNRLPTRGRYSAGDPKVIAADYALFRDLGIDFLIMDDTNGVGVDAGKINDNIRAWFDFMDSKPAAERIPICIGGGGEMRAEGAKGQKRADDFYWENWAKRPSYFRFDGKPLLLVDTDDNYGPADFDDERFALRGAYNGDNFEAMKKNKTWGWGSYEPVPVLDESMSIWPGHRFPKFVAAEGQEGDGVAGTPLQRERLAAVKAADDPPGVSEQNFTSDQGGQREQQQIGECLIGASAPRAEDDDGAGRLFGGPEQRQLQIGFVLGGWMRVEDGAGSFQAGAQLWRQRIQVADDVRGRHPGCQRLACPSVCGDDQVAWLNPAGGLRARVVHDSVSENDDAHGNSVLRAA